MLSYRKNKKCHDKYFLLYIEMKVWPCTYILTISHSVFQTKIYIIENYKNTLSQFSRDDDDYNNYYCRNNKPNIIIV